ncbi:MAG TPA: DUF6448 family protein [Salinimicrobium sp.]|nr:DUF6448 family protein [Salinimicrobium sp.]
MKTRKLKEIGKKSFLLVVIFFMAMLPQQTFGHCDSYDGPVIQDAYKALEAQNVTPILKWIEAKYEQEITDLFNKTLQYRNSDKEVYQLLEKHFLETLVRLHREGEGEPYTGLKPAGTTSKIIQMTDTALKNQDIDTFLEKLNGHIEKMVREKYEKVAALQPVKDNSVEEGRAFVAAYVDYTHTIEALHAILEHDVQHAH